VKKFVKEFRDFIVTGNMIELAVAVILGAAVAAVIKTFTEDVVMNLVAAIFGKPTFNDVFRVKLNDTPKMSLDGKTQLADGTYLEFGRLLTSIITLLMTGLVLFFMIKAYNRLRRPKPGEPAVPTEVELLTEIRDALKARD
jgi:large conductance mechanosensitive channel